MMMRFKNEVAAQNKVMGAEAKAVAVQKKAVEVEAIEMMMRFKNEIALEKKVAEAEAKVVAAQKKEVEAEAKAVAAQKKAVRPAQKKVVEAEAKAVAAQKKAVRLRAEATATKVAGAVAVNAAEQREAEEQKGTAPGEGVGGGGEGDGGIPKTIVSSSEKQNAHSAGVFSVVFSPDGESIVSGSDDRTLKVWDAGTSTAGTHSPDNPPDTPTPTPMQGSRLRRDHRHQQHRTTVATNTGPPLPTTLMLRITTAGLHQKSSKQKKKARIATM